jgi:hypothetical protein
VSKARHAGIWMVAAVAALVLGTAGGTSAQPLDRTPASYHILARTSASLKDYHLFGNGGSCNIGVNDVGGNLGTSAAGARKFEMDVGQLVADDCSQAAGNVNQCFCNAGGNKFNKPCDPWAAPILADDSDATFIKACNDGLAQGDYPAVFVFGATDVGCPKNGDCVPAAADSQLGNGKCDLIPGDYGMVNPSSGCTMVLSGVYNVADWNSAKNGRIEVASPTTLNVAGETEELKLGDNGELMALCGQFRINYRGPLAKPNDRVVNVGRANNGPYSFDLCAPFALLRLRNNNQLRGHFFADAVQSDFNNEGECCGGTTDCGCFDAVAPTTVAVGGKLTLTGGCDLSNISQVRVCDTDCPITLPRDPTMIECTVAAPTDKHCSVCGIACTVNADCPGVGETCDPVPLPRTCNVDGVSSAGFYRNATTVTVTP